MALRQIRLGPMDNIYQYDDGEFSEAIETDQPIKAGTPIAGDDVLRLNDVGVSAGDIIGPGASTDEAIARFNGVTGKLIQNSLVTISDTGSLSLPAGETVDGVDISAHAANVNAHHNEIHNVDSHSDVDLTGLADKDLLQWDNGASNWVPKSVSEVADVNYGSCSMYEGAWSQAAAVQNTWYNVSDADFIDGQLHNVTHDGSGKLTVTNAGIYLCNVSLDWLNSTANDHIEIGFEVNGSGSAQTEGIVCSETKFANEEHMGSTTALLNIGAGQTLELCIRTTDNNTPTITVECVNLNCVQIIGT